MKRDSVRPTRDGEKPSEQRRANAEKPASRGESRGRSGYGIDSLRPHLREQLALKELLRPGVPPQKTPKATA